MKEKIIGIDLGTTNSAVAIVMGGDPVIIPNPEGERITPSVVSFDGNETLVGSLAKRSAAMNIRNTVYSVKRLMGKRFTEAREDVDRLSYRVVEGKEGRAEIFIPAEERNYTPEEISSKILKYLKEAAESYLGQKITKAVITVPAYFNDAQRQATKDAGTIAGLEVMRILPEPTAAALAYGLDKTEKNLRVAVYDLGGGTFDISILELAEGVFEVKSTSGDTHLGGDDFDLRITDWLTETFKAQTGVDIRGNPQAFQQVREAAEKAKKELSFKMETPIKIPFLYERHHLDVSLTRSRLEAMVQDLIDRTINICRQALEDAGLSPSEIDEVILVGGQTRMPAVQEAVRNFFGKTPHKGINPDEVVAVGAAIQAGIIAGEYADRDIVLLDVTPLSLGVEVLYGGFDVVIPRNTTIPTKKTKIYTTAENNQPSVLIKVYQGERPIASENRLLGQFELTGIPPAPRGVPQIEVTFDIDTNGILHVHAREKATGKESQIKIHAKSGLTDEEVQRLVEEAERHAEEDKRKKELVDLKNQADGYLFSVERSMKDFGERMTSQERDEINRLSEELREKIGGDDPEAIRKAFDRLQEAWNRIATKIYQTTGATGGGNPSDDGKDSDEGGDGGPHDTDYKVVE
ncbi:MAG: molecular chaperone DnaK [candidate division WOR-3 bacterium]